ncbi:LysM domain-containing protein, partial [Arcobacter sp. LA11]|uniref:LysM peptidoglycan-binding domain-containing protein n=1 Tax=Arcobacter sp. LA11 TaxID=1898176 RepID=UPI001160DDA5
MAEEENIVHIPNFSYPFKKITDEKKCYELLKDKAEGNYLFSQHGLWHGGLHFDSFFDKEIKCIADGEIVAYKINTKYLQNEGEENEENGLYSTGFILIRHYFEYPKDNKLTFFSLYMHMADKSKYNEEKETTTTYTIKSGDSLSKIASQYKTTVAQIQKDNNIANANSIAVGQKLQIKSKSTDTKPKYIIENPIYDTVQILAEPKSIKAGENIGLVGFYTPPRQKARIATHLEIFTKDDVKNFAKDAKKKYEEDKSPNKPKPTQIKVPIEKDIYKIEEQEIVKTPKANDTATLKDNCETQTEQEPLTNGTQIDVDESSLVCGSRYEVDSIEGKDVSEENFTIYKGSVGTINIPKKTDKKTQEEKIYKLSDVKIIESNKIKYVQIDEETVLLYSDCEELHPITFDWARIIDIQSKDKISIFDSLENHVVPTSVEKNMCLSDSFTELFKLIDKDNNNMLELLEIKEASKKELIKQTTSKYIVKHSSEWHKEINMADVFLDIFSKHKEEIENSCEIDDHYKKQKERIDKLSFFTECKDIEEFPKSDDVYHFNPIGLVGE